MAKNYEEMSKQILELVGGKDNITFFAHCITRLRFNVKDKSLVKVDDLEKVAGILGTQWSGEQLQIIIGQDVDDIYEQVRKAGGFEETEKINENLDKKEPLTVKSFFGNLLDAVSGIMVPIIPAIVGAGLLSGFCVLLQTLQIIDQTSPIYTALTIVSSGAQYYLPMLIAYSSAKKFKCNPVMSIALAGILLAPAYTSLVGTAGDLRIFGIPARMVDYSNSVIPIILIVFVYSYLEKMLGKYTPKMFAFMLNPLLSLLIMLPLSLCIIGPIGSYIGDLLGNVLVTVYNAVGPIGTGLIGALFVPLVSTGMHAAMNQIGGVAYYVNGVDYMYFPAVYASLYGLMGICLGYTLKSTGDQRKVGFSAFVSQALASVSEPAIFGILYRNKKLFAVQIIGGFIGGVLCGALHVGWFLPTPANIVFGVVSFMGGNFIGGIIACIVTFAFCFATSMVLTGKEKA